MSIADRLIVLQREVAAAAIKARRAQEQISIVAVSKKHAADLMRDYIEATRALGISPIFGENYLQELKVKRAALGELGEFHLIGPMQSNKVRDAVRLSDVIQSIHSMKILEMVAKEATLQTKRQRIFLQVNIGRDPDKSGFDVGQIRAAIEFVAQRSDSLILEGLMTITPWYDQPESAREDFKAMSTLRSELIKEGINSCFKNNSIALSMGMSADYHIAIEEGADFVRVGTALFGERPLASA